MADLQPPTPRTPGHRPTHSKRISTLPKAPASIHPAATVANHAVLTGHHAITISAGAVLHPHCKVTSVHGPVVIGEGCIIYEKAVVGIEGDGEAESGRGVVLDRNVVVESGAVVEAALVGEGAVVGVEGRVGVGSAVGRWCQITPRCALPPGSDLPDFSVLYGNNQRRLNYTAQTRPVVTDIRKRAHENQLRLFAKLVPNNAAKWM
ncbi:uncharacterized protein K452DRAFT_302286 [Aplosporella prunicola CBS 121167]|uniref:Dynactin subunit 6 n=1 Tax=Aplosporella prunicola CBS 121167 TaxID=1176127 RepID=A0A6A6AYY3_9PEZI|nr:uncharacterized protein K452DRAFT_302286 [Aplosporella prunicola CBS 121167]KAF2136990.1 hypothetical protein K452DRAFT_302286 [Aplosporella prunicola CBS 121167]